MPDTTLPAPTLPTLLTSGPRSFEEIVPKDGPVTYGKSSLLLQAVTSSNLRDVEFALAVEEGKREDIDTLWQGQRALTVAVAKTVEEGDVGYKMTAMLLKHGANPRRVQGESQAPMDIAAQACSSAALQLLRKNNATALDLSLNGGSLFHALALVDMPSSGAFRETEFKRCVAWLLAEGACPCHADAEGRTAKQCAKLPAASALLAHAEAAWMHACSCVTQEACSPHLPNDVLASVMTFLS